ncbi:MAG TPA: HupE/UreJ family protein [Candidatus Methylomirabilis sp.]|nr:HupE/UreJ family protein [Candidatus Methylomirabilis sp.]
MTHTFGKAAAVFAFVTAVSIPGSAGAHNISGGMVMNAFVKLERSRAHLVIRVPVRLLAEMSIPVDVTGALGPERGGSAISRALTAITEGITIQERGVPLVPMEAVGRLTLSSDRTFESYEEAVAHVARPTPPQAVMSAGMAFLDAHVTYPIGDPGSDYTIQTKMLPQLGESVKLVVRFIRPVGTIRAYEITSLSGPVPLDPHWYQAARVFVTAGFFHILDGIDHLLFLLCLVIPFDNLWALLPIVTSFTVAHSVTLIGSAYGAVPTGEWFPPLVETLIAASIVYMALENIIKLNLRRRWLITGAFGLVHGFGFSYGLAQTLQFAGSHLLVSLLSFNVGIELGQLAVLLLTLPALRLLLGQLLPARPGMIGLSTMVAGTGLYWMLERAQNLWRVPWPNPNAAAAVTAGRWVLLVLLVAGAGWISRKSLRRHATGPGPSTKEDIA